MEGSDPSPFSTPVTSSPIYRKDTVVHAGEGHGDDLGTGAFDTVDGRNRNRIGKPR